MELVDKAYRVQVERDKASGVEAIVVKIKDPEIRDALARHLRAVKNLERVGGLIKQRSAEKTSSGRKADIGAIKKKLNEQIEHTKVFIQKTEIPPKVKKAVLEFIDPRGKQEGSR